MLVTLTSKGRVTLPREIRDRLRLGAGALLEFQLMPDDTITVRAVRPAARRIRGLLQSPHLRPLPVDEMDAGIDRHLREKHLAASSRTRFSGK